MKNLENYGVQELSVDDVQNIEGGIVFATAACLFALGVAVGAGIGTVIQRR